MAIDAAAPFEIETPAAEKIFVEKLADLQPETVYALAIANMPQQRFNDFKMKAARKTSAAAKGNMYPSLSMVGSLGSRYNSRANEITGVTFSNDTIGKVIVGGVPYGVFAAFPDYTSRKQPFFSQLNKNFNQSVGLSLRIPIFNGLSTRTNYEKTKINIRNQELQKELDNQTLKQDIYKAYNAAVVALEKLHAGKKTLETAERTLYYAQKRDEAGMMGTFELITNQNNLFRAKLEHALNQFDYVFKMKVLEFYKGQGLKF